MSRPFADAVAVYALAGWPVIPVPPETKTPPPIGFTGADGVDADATQLVRWAGSHATSSLAIRMPEGVIGIDVDDYVKGAVTKRGRDTLERAIGRFGSLPATWSSTARGDGPSRIYFYRVPVDRYATVLGRDVEIIQRHHRYAVVWPSIHLGAGAAYQWYDPHGLPSEPPKPGELPELPAAWVTGLREGAAQATDVAAPRSAGELMWSAIVEDERPACAQMATALLDAHRLIESSTTGTRHDAADDRAWNLVQLAADGHPGLGVAFEQLTELWDQVTAGEQRGEEWSRLFITAARKAVTRIARTTPVDRDPCFEAMGLTLIPAPAPGTVPGSDPAEPIAPPRRWSTREAIGAHLFDPPFNLDHPLAEAVLERMYPVMRYAYDSHGWLRRGPECWEDLTDLSEWAITEVASLMPHGDPDAEKGSEAFIQAARRRRFMSGGPSGAIAKKMRALLAGGTHPCSVAAAELDRDPWLLWAGGVAWDLRASYAQPTPARVDPATPHLRAAAVAPVARPTPLWDAFTAAVWPDPELRAWALRVLSVAVTGDAAKVLPILVGEGDRGKTQVIVLIMSVLGSYAHAADPRLLGGTDRSHASIVTALKGRRLSFIDEAPRDAAASQERLKQLTGGGELTGNDMGRNPITFIPTHTLILTANEAPLLTDPAVRRRVRLVPCEGDPVEVIAARRAIGHPTSAAWQAEAPGVLAALMREAAGWLEDENTARTESAPAAYRFRAEEIAAEQNVVNAWIDAECEPFDAGTPSPDLRRAFVDWVRAMGSRDGQIPGMTKWGMELTRLGYPATHRRTGNYRALRLKPKAAWFTPGEHVVNTFEATPSRAEEQKTPANPGDTAPPVNTVKGVNTSNQLIGARTPARTHTRDGIQPSPTHPFTPPRSAVTEADPPSIAAGITERLLQAKAAAAVSHINPDPAPPPAAILCGPAEPSREDIAAVAEFAQQLQHQAAPTSETALSGPERLRLEWHQLCEQQDRRVEAATNGVLTDKRGRPSEEVQRYFGEGEFEGSGVEPRLTWTRFLEQRRPEREFEKTQQAAWEAGARLGRKHATRRVADADTEFDKTANGHDLEMFAAGYTSGISEHDQRVTDAAGERVPLPAVVTRDGAVRPIGVHAVPELLGAFGATAELTVDVEHTGFPIGHPDYQLRTIQIGNEHVAVVYDAHDSAQREQAKQLLADAAILHAHSATADLVPLADAGVILDLDEAWSRMHDTVIPALLADPNSTGSDADGLKGLAGDMLGDAATSPRADLARAELFKTAKWLTNTKATTPAARSGWAQVDPTCTTMVRYAASDVLDAAAIATRLPAVPPHVLDRERTAQAMTARVAQRGLAIDRDQVNTLLPEHAAGREAAAQQMRGFGIDNPGSDQQVAAALTKLGAPLTATRTGRPSVAKGTLDPLRTIDGPIGDLVRARLEYQRHDTAITMFLEPYRVLVESGDGRARPTVYTLGADTGRMSCVRPNLQQVPRQGGMRACLTADPGTLLVSADFAGVEIRVAAALSGDRNLQHMLATGVDLHWEIARQVFGPEATKADRYNVKRGVFGRLYGGGIPTLARQVGISETTAAAMVDTLDAMTPELAAWSRAVRDAVKAGHTQFPTYSGRIIHLPAQFPHKAPNYCIQGTARELLVDTLMRWRDTTWGTATLLPVHDEIVVVIAEHDSDAATAQLVACMETELHGVHIAGESSTPSYAWQDAA